MHDTRYLVHIRNRWYVQRRVPQELRAHFGKTHLLRSTGTSSLPEACRLKHAILADFQSQLDEARETMVPTGAAFVTHMQARGRRMKQQVLNGELTPEQAMGEWELWLDQLDFESNAGAAGSIKTIGRTLASPQASLGAAIQAYLADCAGLKACTVATRRRRLTSLQDALGDIPMSDLSRTVAVSYLDHHLKPRGLARRTLQAELGDLSTFGGWCVDRGLCTTNPFHRLGRSLRGVDRRPPQRTGWSSADLLRALRASDGVIQQALLLGMYSGCRSTEMAHLKREHIHPTHFEVHNSKTAAGIRVVPWHPQLQPWVPHLLDRPVNSYVLQDLSAIGADQSRGRSLSAKFSKWKIKAGLPAELCLHGLRHTVVQQLVDQSWPENEIQALVGHKSRQLIYSTYSRGVPLERLGEVLRSVDYGTEVTEEVGCLVAGLSDLVG